MQYANKITIFACAHPHTHAHTQTRTRTHTTQHNTAQHSTTQNIPILLRNKIIDSLVSQTSRTHPTPCQVSAESVRALAAQAPGPGGASPCKRSACIETPAGPSRPPPESAALRAVGDHWCWRGPGGRGSIIS